MLVSAGTLSSMLDAVGEAVYHTDLDRRIVHWNAACARITGHEGATVVGRRCQDRIIRHVDAQGKDLCSSPDCPLLVPLRTGAPHQADLFLHHLDGHLVPVAVRTLVHRDAEDRPTGITQIFSERALGPKSRPDWRRVALTDALTGIGNRRAFRLAWGRAYRNLSARGQSFGLLMIDVDHFKRVNDSHGHALGDKVLRMVARTLAGCVRQNDLVVRWGGEEFLVLLSRADEELLADLAERLRSLVEKGWVALADGGHLGVTVSVGGTLVGQGDGPEESVGRADRRLFACKEAGRNRCRTAD